LFFFKVFERTIAGVERRINVWESHRALPRMHGSANTVFRFASNLCLAFNSAAESNEIRRQAQKLLMARPSCVLFRDDHITVINA